MNDWKMARQTAALEKRRDSAKSRRYATSCTEPTYTHMTTLTEFHAGALYIMY